jgi:hypothetical protein
MDILVSFCNVFPERPALCVLDATTSAVRIVPIPGEQTKYSGVRGLWLSDRYLYLVRQEVTGITSPALFVFDRSNFDLLSEYVFRSTGDIHSICGSDSILYAVSTGTDEILKLEMQGREVVSETVIWRPEPTAARSDIHHLNAICSRNGDLLVCGFGKKSAAQWTSASDGFIFNVTRGEMMADGIQNPHSLALIGDTLVYCESKTQMVRAYGDSRSQALPGYARGLCVAGDKLFVGTSIGRRVSKSTGMLNSATVGSGTRAGGCTVSRLSADTFEIEKTIDLGLYGDEIYDLLLVENTSKWPTAPASQFASPLTIWQHRLEIAKRELAAVVPSGEMYILFDEDTWGAGEVLPSRRRIVFLDRDGRYWAPSDDESAIERLTELQRAGVSFIAFAWPAFWWFDYYKGFHQHVRSNYRCVLKSERLVIFDLRSMPHPRFA